MKEKTNILDRIKQILTGIFVIFLFFFISAFRGLPFKLLGIDTSTLPTIVTQSYIIISEILLISIICIIYHKNIEDSIKDFKKNHKKYFNKYLKYWVIGLIIMYTSNIIIGSFYKMPSNEETIRTLFGVNPIYIFISSVFLAPILEELTFRKAIKSIFKNKWVFIIMSGLIFGYLHIMSFNNLLELLYIIPYGTFGVVFACMLYDTDNICVPILFHFMHNGIFMSLQFFMMFFM